MKIEGVPIDLYVVVFIIFLLIPILLITAGVLQSSRRAVKYGAVPAIYRMLPIIRKYVNTKYLAIYSVLLLAIFTFYSFDKRFSPAAEKEYYPIKCTSDSTLTIGIIGDSWVSKGKLEAPLIEALQARGVQADVISWGHGGFKSKQIYDALFEDAQYVIRSCPDYVIVIAGVNDSLSMLGEDYYVSNLQAIVAFLQHYGITPVIMELPAFELKEGQDAANPLGRIRTLGMAWINGTYDRDNIEKYRKALDGKLEGVIMVDFDPVSSGYSPDLYKDFTHLNDKGNRKMMDTAVSAIFE